jgi:hypothetical protein
MNELIIFGSLFSVLVILYGTRQFIHNRHITRSTQRALDYMHDNIISVKSESENSPEKLAALANEIKYSIHSEALENILPRQNLRFKIAFLVLYRHFNEIPLEEAEKTQYVGLYDLKLFWSLQIY